MHYYIDGYNCLFCSEGIQNNLHLQRTRFLERLRTCIQALNLSVTIVFDSMIQAESTRSHLSPLECIYTNKYETADHYLLALIQHSRFPSRITLVTSDNALATAARHAGAQTIEALPFLNWLTQRYAKVKHKQRTQVAQVAHVKAPSKKPIESKVQKEIQQEVQKGPSSIKAVVQPVIVPPKETPKEPPKKPKESLLNVFEERYRTLCEEETAVSSKEHQAMPKPKPQPKPKLKSVMSQKKPKEPKLRLESETARWQRLFEQNSQIQSAQEEDDDESPSSFT